MYLYSLLNILLFTLFLSACNPQADEQRSKQLSTDESPEEERYLPLSTGQETQSPNTEEASMNVQEVLPEPGYSVPQEKPAEQGHLLQSLEQGTQQDATIPRPSFQDFKNRWNAISREQNSNLMIAQLEKSTNDTDSFYYASFSKRLELRVFASNQYIHKIQIVGEGKTASELYSMLAGWSQIFFLLHPGAEPHHVDDLFNNLGIGPNVNLSQVEEKTIPYEGVQYTVLPTETGYIFTAAYTD